MRDLVTYEEKRNEANLEGNRDGTTDNRSWNCGVEGETDDVAVNDLRDRQRRNFLATLLLSHGVPMLLAGDEIGRTQQGNNNAYCQDNEISWVNWEQDDSARSHLAFTKRLIALRHQHPGVSKAVLPHGARARGLGCAGRLVVPPGRSRDDAG